MIGDDEIAVLSKVVREGISEEMTFQQNRHSGKGKTLVTIKRSVVARDLGREREG